MTWLDRGNKFKVCSHSAVAPVFTNKYWIITCVSLFTNWLQLIHLQWGSSNDVHAASTHSGYVSWNEDEFQGWDEVVRAHQPTKPRLLDIVCLAKNHAMLGETAVAHFAQIHVTATAFETLSMPEVIQRLQQIAIGDASATARTRAHRLAWIFHLCRAHHIIIDRDGGRTACGRACNMIWRGDGCTHRELQI